MVVSEKTYMFTNAGHVKIMGSQRWGEHVTLFSGIDIEIGTWATPKSHSRP